MMWLHGATIEEQVRPHWVSYSETRVQFQITALKHFPNIEGGTFCSAYFPERWNGLHWSAQSWPHNTIINSYSVMVWVGRSRLCFRHIGKNSTVIPYLSASLGEVFFLVSGCHKMDLSHALMWLSVGCAESTLRKAASTCFLRGTFCRAQLCWTLDLGCF